ncbi:15405_t:CDS:2, partial [Acaulospora morrowiae]
ELQFSRSKIVDLKDDLRIIWTNDHLRSLIDERKTRNVEYYDIVDISREDFWNSIANKINGQFNITYSGYQCKGKFQSLVKNYNSMCLYMSGDNSGRKSRTGKCYFEEFRTRFWEKPVAVNLRRVKEIDPHLQPEELLAEETKLPIEIMQVIW